MSDLTSNLRKLLKKDTLFKGQILKPKEQNWQGQLSLLLQPSKLVILHMGLSRR